LTQQRLARDGLGADPGRLGYVSALVLGYDGPSLVHKSAELVPSGLKARAATSSGSHCWTEI